MMWMCVFAALAADPQPADTPVGRPIDLAEEAELHFQLGAKDYAAGQLQEALSHLLRSYRLAPNRNTAFNIARVYDSLERPDQAWRYYALALHGENDPELRAPIQQAMTRLEPEIARVQVTTSPPGATVYVGARDLGARGVTPMTMALLPGKHDIVLELEGHAPVELPRLFPDQGLYQVDARLERDEATSANERVATTWVESVLMVDGVLVVQASPDRCAVLPDLLQNVSTWREPMERRPGPAPGSMLAAQEPMSSALDIVTEGSQGRRITRVPLTRQKKQLWYDQASLAHAWAFNRCEVTNGVAIGDALEEMKKADREPVVAILAELAKPGNVREAAAECVKGDCARFGAMLRAD